MRTRRHNHKLQLIWDVDRFRCHINGIEVAVAPVQFPPFIVEAAVEEQDTSLVLGESNEIRDPGNKPVWYFANRLQSLAPLTPGEIIVRKSRPLRIQAIIHDLDQEPICNEYWVRQVVQKIFAVTITRHIQSLQTPLLGTRYGDLEVELFIQILLETLTRQKTGDLKRLWLVTPEQQCESVFRQLKILLTRYTP
ncbi:MAG: hypothetical protein L0Z73_10030 [Gammaproteobacteria bacterium]|nr:hypothetical protein [Gammaproteobacteria bacterium]